MDRQNNSADPWYADPEFWDTFYTFIFPPESFETAEKNISAYIKYSGVNRGNVLDLACGPGRYAVPLAKLGFKVDAVDIQQSMLEKARFSAALNSENPRYHQSDAASFIKPEYFDLVLLLYNSFGYYDNRQQDQSLIESAYANLKEGGVFLLELKTRREIEKSFSKTYETQLASGIILTEVRSISKNGSQMITAWQLEDPLNPGNRSFVSKMNLYYLEDLTGMLAEVGFKKINAFGDWDFKIYDKNSKQLLLSAEK